MQLPSWMSDLGRGVLDVIYPPRCLGCGARAHRPDLPLCAGCLQSMERAPDMGVAARLDRLPVAPTALDDARALWIFDKGGALQAVQHALKYGDRPAYGAALGRIMGRADWESLPRLSGVVPIPLHRTRLLERGYNQAAALGTGMAEALVVPLRDDLLHRPRPTLSQTDLSRTERWSNVSRAFRAEPEAAGGTWLLVDDIMTTGSTAVAAAQTLREAGAASVTLAVLALART